MASSLIGVRVGVHLWADPQVSTLLDVPELNPPSPESHAQPDESSSRDPSALSIWARGLQISTPLTRLVGPLDLAVPVGSVVAVAGPSRSGKSLLLLALTGRMRGVSGTLTVAGEDGIASPGRARARSAVARLQRLVVPEESLTLEDCITERTLMDAAKPRERHARYLRAAGLLSLDSRLDVLYGDLSPADQTRAAIALARIRPADVLVVDDLDLGATLSEQHELWAGLLALSGDGCTVIASTTERAAIPASALIVDLNPENSCSNPPAIP